MRESSRLRPGRDEDEAGDEEVAVEGEGLGDIPLPHHGKADCVREAEILVGVAGEDLFRFRVEHGIGVDDEDSAALAKRA